MDKTLRSKVQLCDEPEIKVAGNVLSTSLRESKLEFCESLI